MNGYGGSLGSNGTKALIKFETKLSTKVVQKRRGEQDVFLYTLQTPFKLDKLRVHIPKVTTTRIEEFLPSIDFNIVELQKDPLCVPLVHVPIDLHNS